MTPPLPEPLLPDADPSHTARAALKALFEKLRREKLPLLDRAGILGECKGLWRGLYDPTRRDRTKPRFTEVAAEGIGWSESWLYRLLRLCKLLSPDERTALKGAAIENSIRYLFKVAQIRDAGERAATISALSDVGNPAPSLHEALNRAGLHRYTSAEQTHIQARSLARAWRRANPDALKKFAAWMSAERPKFGPSLTTSVDVYLGKEGRES